jgi:hypothetical protein
VFLLCAFTFISSGTTVEGLGQAWWADASQGMLWVLVVKLDPIPEKEGQPLKARHWTRLVFEERPCWSTCVRLLEAS